MNWRRARIVAIAKSHLGAHFRIGTTGMRYFDCSGLVYRVYQQAHDLRKGKAHRARDQQARQSNGKPRAVGSGVGEQSKQVARRASTFFFIFIFV